MANFNAGRGEKPVRCFKALHRGEGRGLCLGGVMRGQSVALLGIKHGIALHVGNFALGLLAPGVGLGAGDAVGIDHELAGLALADMPAELKRLLEGQPQRAGISLGHGGRPQHHDIDALVRDSVMTKRAGDPAGGVFGVPRPVPRADALLQIGDDLAGDAAVNVADFAHGCSSFSCFLVAAAAATLPRGERGVARRRNKMRDVE
jgi:hypothetical protein